MSREQILKNMAKSVIDGEIELAQSLLQQALDEDIDPNVCINEGFKPGLDEIGRGFDSGEYFLPDLILAGKIMEAVVNLLKEKSNIDVSTGESMGKVVIATVEGDLHSIGKQLVSMMLSLNGFEVVDIGQNIPTATIVEKVKEEKPVILGLSALLSTTTGAQKDVIDSLNQAGIRDTVKVLVGGAVVSREWADEIGADGYAEDANSTVREAKRVLGIN